MYSRLLEELKAADFQVDLAFVATPSALRRLLELSSRVHRIRAALASGELTEDMIRHFVNTLMRDLQRGQPFEHDLVIAALAVALERRGTPFAEEFLQDLSRLEASEMAMSIRVARECLRVRVGIAGNNRSHAGTLEQQATRSFTYEALADSYPRSEVGQSRRTVKCGAS